MPRSERDKIIGGWRDEPTTLANLAAKMADDVRSGAPPVDPRLWGLGAIGDDMQPGERPVASFQDTYGESYEVDTVTFLTGYDPYGNPIYTSRLLAKPITVTEEIMRQSVARRLDLEIARAMGVRPEVLHAALKANQPARPSPPLGVYRRPSPDLNLASSAVPPSKSARDVLQEFADALSETLGLGFQAIKDKIGSIVPPKPPVPRKRPAEQPRSAFCPVCAQEQEASALFCFSCGAQMPRTDGTRRLDS